MIANQILSNVSEVFSLFERFGGDEYVGEAISQLEHATQSAQLAEDEGYDEEVILAALLHDIGHLFAKTKNFKSMDMYGAIRHEKIGADYLRLMGFSPKVVLLVENHVRAKRYLTFKNPEYFELLTDASKRTLDFQGGAMSAQEAFLFETDDYFDLSIKMRTWDEKAKEIHIPVPDIGRYKIMAIRNIGK